MPDFLPIKDAELQAWLANFASGVTKDAELLGFTTADVKNLEDRVTEFADSVGNVNVGKTAFEAAVVTKQTTRSLTEAEVRELVRRIQANPNVDNAVRVNLGITVKSDARTSTPPTTPTDVIVQPLSNGVNLLVWSRNTNKPNTQFLIECKSPAADGWAFVAVNTKTRFSHTGQTHGPPLLYRITAQRAEQGSLPSEPVMVYGK
jgi:hypothetical protein